MPEGSMGESIPEIAVCLVASSLDINILDNGGRLNVSFFSEKSTLESDMFGMVRGRCFNLQTIGDVLTVGHGVQVARFLEMMVRSSRGSSRCGSKGGSGANK